MNNNIRRDRILLALFAMALVLGARAQEKDSLDQCVVGSNLNIGIGNTLMSDGNYGGAIGRFNTVAGTNTIALGTNNTVTMLGAMALGYGNVVTANMNIAIGVNTKATGNNGPSIVIGSGFMGQTGEGSLLENGVSNSLAIGFVSTKPTFFVSPSPNNYSQGVTDRTGKVAIGDVTPAAKLHVRSDDGEAAGLILEPANPQSDSSFIMLHDNTHAIRVSSQGDMRMTSGNHALSLDGSSLTLNGKVGVNTENTTIGYAFAVEGGLITDKLLIRNVEEWPDYVFDPSYPLMPLSTLQDYLIANRHLPELPSAQEVESEGVDVAEMQQMLLREIEKLNLYIIEQQSLIEDLQKKVERLENQ